MGTRKRNVSSQLDSLLEKAFAYAEGSIPSVVPNNSRDTGMGRYTQVTPDQLQAVLSRLDALEQTVKELKEQINKGTNPLDEL